MPFSAANRMVSRRLQATHSGGWGFCTGLGTTLRGGMVHERPVDAGEGGLGHAAQGHLETLQPGLPLDRRFDAEAAAARPRTRTRRNRTRPDPPIRGRAWRCVRRCGPDGCTPGRSGRCRGPGASCVVRWLAAARNTSGAEEWEYSSRKWCSTSHTYWMPEAVGQLDLVEGVGDELVLAALVPGPRELVLVEDAELARCPPLSPGTGRWRCRPGCRRGRRRDRAERQHLIDEVVTVGPVAGWPARSRAMVAARLSRRRSSSESLTARSHSRLDHVGAVVAPAR